MGRCNGTTKPQYLKAPITEALEDRTVMRTTLRQEWTRYPPLTTLYEIIRFNPIHIRAVVMLRTNDRRDNCISTSRILKC